jgi:Ribbon-helix-helix protein, copG family
MERTQIYLSSNEVKLLSRAAAQTGASKSELIRQAIREKFGEPSVADRLAALRRSAGAWKDRDFTGAEYVDAMRGDLNDRLRRLGFD